MPEAGSENSRNLPAVQPPPQPGLRAFRIFGHVPRGRTAFQEPETRHEPHIHRGEFAIVDCQDREIVFGEVYLIMQSEGPILWQIDRTRDKELILNPHLADCCWLRPLNNPPPRRTPDGRFRWPDGMHMSDGPVRTRYIADRVIGHVIGIYARFN